MIDLCKLLDSNTESGYWTGFIFADGSISPQGHFNISLAEKDKEHLEKLKTFFSYSKPLRYASKTNSYRLFFRNKKCVQQLINNLSLLPRKTYNPPNTQILSNLSISYLISLIIGFIDGDGYIRKFKNRKDCQIITKVHSSWLPVLIWMRSIILDNINVDSNPARINNEGFATWSITGFKNLQRLKSFALTNNLPILNRKWDLIDMNHISKRDIKMEVYKLKNLGFSNDEVSKSLCISKPTINTIMWKFRTGKYSVTN